jgi:hypothetical protein
MMGKSIIVSDDSESIIAGQGEVVNWIIPEILVRRRRPPQQDHIRGCEAGRSEYDSLQPEEVGTLHWIETFGSDMWNS